MDVKVRYFVEQIMIMLYVEHAREINKQNLEKNLHY